MATMFTDPSPMQCDHICSTAELNSKGVVPLPPQYLLVYVIKAGGGDSLGEERIKS